MLVLAIAIVFGVVALSIGAAASTGSASWQRSSDDNSGDLSPQEAILAARTLGHPVYGFNGDGSRGDDSQADAFDEDDDS